MLFQQHLSPTWATYSGVRVNLRSVTNSSSFNVPPLLGTPVLKSWQSDLSSWLPKSHKSNSGYQGPGEAASLWGDGVQQHTTFSVTLKQPVLRGFTTANRTARWGGCVSSLTRRQCLFPSHSASPPLQTCGGDISQAWPHRSVIPTWSLWACTQVSQFPPASSSMDLIMVLENLAVLYHGVSWNF